MDAVITSADQVTPAWLTARLWEAGVLSQGEVATVHSVSQPTLGSVIVNLRVRYTRDAPSTAPTRLILKLSKPERTYDGMENKELLFYTALAPHMPHPPVPACYAASYDPETRAFHLLLEDKSATHYAIADSSTASREQVEQALRSLAVVHAYWWKRPMGGYALNALPPRISGAAEIDDFEQLVPHFLAFLGDHASPLHRAIYDTVLRRRHRLEQLAREMQHLTLIHGDAHLENYLYPRAATHNTACIIDWDGWTIDLGTMDLAYMIGLHWYPDRRTVLEQPLVRWYYDGLVVCGVPDYDWETCWRDYRYAIIYNLFVPVWFWSIDLPEELWRAHMARSLLAFEDLHCADLLA